MASSSLANFSLYAHSSLSRNLKTTPYRTSQISPNSSSISIIPFHNKNEKRPLCFSLKLQCTPARPTSILASKIDSLSSQKNISRTITEKILTLFLGSLIFAGSLGARTVLAQPVSEETSQSEHLEEKIEAQVDESEEEEMYVKLLERNPRDVDALKMVVNLKMKNGKTKEALGYVERLIKIQPNEMEWRLLQALCYEMMGQLGMAKKLFKDILKRRPLLLRALHGLAMAMHKNHEGPAVFEMLERALELARRETRVIEERNIKILIAQMYLVKGDLEEALEKFQILIDENPRDFRPYLCQGIVFSLLNKGKEAQERFEIYQSLVPEGFPQRKFLDDVMLAAKTEPRHKLEKDLQG
ncbi:OLC1v1008968C1 [Oldenlandia corymbosa var. corymbosa]|uniref:OLC1v1008968C1 n=1 Tax=Oldenlandia corymbosa var. corymbosa TaxID=529605 RepID=A0AAV1DMS3_OLDCO|nr:OLC1v1008968C1 [Oldenlandia corymbosa var. corymbosa]